MKNKLLEIRFQAKEKLIKVLKMKVLKVVL